MLSVYGGLEGLSRNPPWLIAVVLKTWFTEAERKLLVDFMFQGLKREAKTPVMEELRTVGGPREAPS